MNGLFENGNTFGSSLPMILLVLCLCGNGFGGCGPEPNSCCNDRCGNGFGGMLPIILLLALSGGGFGKGCCCG